MKLTTKRQREKQLSKVIFMIEDELDFYKDWENQIKKKFNTVPKELFFVSDILQEIQHMKSMMEKIIKDYEDFLPPW